MNMNKRWPAYLVVSVLILAALFGQIAYLGKTQHVAASGPGPGIQEINNTIITRDIPFEFTSHAITIVPSIPLEPGVRYAMNAKFLVGDAFKGCEFEAYFLQHGTANVYDRNIIRTKEAGDLQTLSLNYVGTAQGTILDVIVVAQGCSGKGNTKIKANPTVPRYNDQPASTVEIYRLP